MRGIYCAAFPVLWWLAAKATRVRRRRWNGKPTPTDTRQPPAPVLRSLPQPAPPSAAATTQQQLGGRLVSN